MRSYVPNTVEERREMLKTLGLSEMDELFADIPADLKLNRELDLPAPMSEMGLRQLITGYVLQNDEACLLFRGAGAYHHYIPALIPQLISRSEFYTAYTPYQAEMSRSMYCRHCTRRRFAGQNDCEVPMQQIDKCIDYVAAHPEVRDVLLSGGDSLMVSDEVLEYIIKRVRAIPHVEIVRLGSRTPVVCPQRITPELCAMLKKYHPVWLNTHFNTPKEFTPEAAKACAMLADAGIPLGNQSVLLAGVNDCSHVMMELVHGLVKMRVRPYYIYACDPSLGLSHFRTPVSKGIEIMEALRGHTSGYCIPTFVVDAPGGGGKTPVMPNYLISETPRKVILRNSEGVITCYTQPEHYV